MCSKKKKCHHADGLLKKAGGKTYFNFNFALCHLSGLVTYVGPFSFSSLRTLDNSILGCKIKLEYL